MKRLIFAVGILTLSSATLMAQSGPSATNFSSSLPATPQPQTQTTTTQTTTSTYTTGDWRHDRPIFTFPIGGSYTLTNVNSVNGGLNTSFFGWYAAPTIQYTRHIAARFDLEQDFDTHAQFQEGRLLRATAGPELTFPLPLISKWTAPFVYAEGGATRLSYPFNPYTGHQPYIQWEATAVGGFGLQVPITRRIGFQLIPGEYSTFQLDNDNWMGNFSAKAGFVLNFYGDH